MSIEKYIDSTNYLKCEKYFLLDCLRKTTITKKYGCFDIHEPIDKYTCFVDKYELFGDDWDDIDGIELQIGENFVTTCAPVTNYGNAFTISDGYSGISDYKVGHLERDTRVNGTVQLCDGIIDFLDIVTITLDGGRLKSSGIGMLNELITLNILIMANVQSYDQINRTIKELTERVYKLECELTKKNEK